MSHPRIISLDSRLWFPDPGQAWHDGLVAVGGDMSVPRLLLAYRTGVFPWTVDPLTWWSPDPRGILELDELHISRSLTRTLRRTPFTVTFDRAFPDVIRACARVPRRDGASWVTPEFVAAYSALHREGHAHSVETWHEGRLVGGLYGVALGGLFSGESMFHTEDDAAKVALVHLVRHLNARGYVLFDTQMVTPTTAALGARNIPRSEYLRRLEQAVRHDATFLPPGARLRAHQSEPGEPVADASQALDFARSPESEPPAR